MRERISFPGLLLGLIGGVAILYVGVLASTWLPAAFILYGLPLPILLAGATLGGSMLFRKKANEIDWRSWKTFAISFSVSFVIAAASWIALIASYSDIS